MRRIVATVALATGILAGATAPAQQSLPGLVVYKDPGCGCCGAWAEHMEANGFPVTVKTTDDISGMSRAAGIPDDFQGCHLAIVDGYIVSGHVPAATVKKLLSERPAIRGITLPGMPLGSPGMGGGKEAPFTIYAISDDAPEVYAVE